MVRAPRKLVEEVDDRPRCRAPEAVDRLVVVAHDRDIPARLCHQRDELGLGPVHVLELVHQHVPEAGLQLRPRGGVLADEPQGERHLVAEVDRPRLAEQLLVAGIGARQLGLPAGRLEMCLVHRVVRRAALRLSRQAGRVRRERGRRHVLVLQPREEGREGGEEPGRVPERAILVEVQPEEPLGQEDHRLGPRQDPRLRREAELQGVLADHAVAEGVERRDDGVRVAVRDEPIDPGLHLVGCLVGEGRGRGSPRASRARSR